jgi:hypothetical protein
VKPAPVVVACLLALVAAAPASAQPSPAPGMVASVAPVTAPSLYKRLGGYDALAAVTDDFLQRLVGDAQFARFFGGHSSDSLK